jgi:hypothetical protein
MSSGGAAPSSSNDAKHDHRWVSTCDLELIGGWTSRTDLDASLAREASTSLTFFLPPPAQCSSLACTSSSSSSMPYDTQSVLQYLDNLEPLFFPQLSSLLPSNVATPLLSAIVESMARGEPEPTNSGGQCHALQHCAIAKRCIESHDAIDISPICMAKLWAAKPQCFARVVCAYL